MKWVNINDEKPLDDQIVLGWQKGMTSQKFPIFCYYDEKEDCFYPIFAEQCSKIVIEYWYRVPKPPKEYATNK